MGSNAIRFLQGAVFLVLAAAMGCGGPATVTGTITNNGKALTRGEIHFVGADGKSASGSINSDGTYFIKGVPVGEVKVSIRSYYVEGADKFGIQPQKTAPPMKSAVATKYNDPSTSGLNYTIDSSNQTIDIKLTD